MFGFLKKKLKDAVDKFTKKAEEEVVEEVKERPKVEKKKPSKPKEKKPKVKEKREPKPVEEAVKEFEQVEELEIKEEPVTEEIIEKEELVEEEPEEKKGFLAKIFGKKELSKVVEKPEKSVIEKFTDKVTQVSISDKKFDELFWDLELAMLENNVAVEVIEKIKHDLKQDLVNQKIPKKTMDKKILESLRHSVEELFNTDKINLISEIKKKKPYIICIVGINGSGKTTTIAKLVHMLKQNNLECVVGASDTFRAAAIQQLEEHTNKLGVKLIKHDYGSDPAAVAYDAVEHAKAKNKDVVLIDTAGRLHSNQNLMQELEKVIRVVKPDLKIFVGESIAGNDVVEQVKLFNDKVGIDAIILAKADIDEKGGAAISVSYVTGKPIMYLGMGQNYEDLAEFNKDLVIEQIGL